MCALFRMRSQTAAPGLQARFPRFLQLGRSQNALLDRPENESMTDGAELKRVVALADQLALRILTEIELTIEEFGTSREIALVAEVGAMLQDAGLELPPGIHRLGRKAAEQAQV
jgi:hypothetical protein